MKTPRDTDPIRWRDLPSPPSENATQDQTECETEIEVGAAARSLGARTPPDEFRLAKVRQRVLSRLDLGSRQLPVLRRAWFRTAALVLASLCVGGVATAVTGRLIARHRLDKAGPVVVPPKDNRAQGGRQVARRWRVAVNAPAQLDLVVDRDGTEVAMVEGQAAISATGASPATKLDPGMSWRGVAPDPEPSPVATVPIVPSTPSTPIFPILPASVPAIGARSEAPRGPQSRARVHHEGTRMVAVVAASDSHTAPGVSVATAMGDRAAVELVPSPLPGPSRTAIETSPPGAPHAARGSGGSTPSSTASAPPRISEAALLGRALRHLRSDHDPRGALAQIDEHDRRFPEGALKREAALARAEALLALERKASALAVLDALKLEGATVDRRVELARAELRAASGRRTDAVADFDAVLKSGADDDIGGRAQFGRAILRARAGDTVGARDDLREYLRRADNSRRNEAERMLRRLGG